jgi:hypothetical protein
MCHERDVCFSKAFSLRFLTAAIAVAFSPRRLCAQRRRWRTLDEISNGIQQLHTPGVTRSFLPFSWSSTRTLRLMKYKQCHLLLSINRGGAAGTGYTSRFAHQQTQFAVQKYIYKSIRELSFCALGAAGSGSILISSRMASAHEIQFFVTIFYGPSSSSLSLPECALLRRLNSFRRGQKSASYFSCLVSALKNGLSNSSAAAFYIYQHTHPTTIDARAIDTLA